MIQSHPIPLLHQDAACISDGLFLRYNCFPCDFDACADCAAKEGLKHISISEPYHNYDHYIYHLIYCNNDIYHLKCSNDDHHLMKKKN